MPVENAPRPAPRGANSGLLQTISDAQRAVATKGKEADPVKFARDSATQGQPTRPESTQLTGDAPTPAQAGKAAADATKAEQKGNPTA